MKRREEDYFLCTASSHLGQPNTLTAHLFAHPCALQASFAHQLRLINTLTRQFGLFGLLLLALKLPVMSGELPLAPAVVADGPVPPPLVKCGAVGCRVPMSVIHTCRAAACSKTVHEVCCTRAVAIKCKVEQLIDPVTKSPMFVWFSAVIFTKRKCGGHAGAVVTTRHLYFRESCCFTEWPSRASNGNV